MTDVPGQIVFPCPDVILTKGITVAVTCMDILLLFAVGVVTQLALLVRTHEIISPFERLTEAYVELFVPTEAPFFFH